MFVGMNQFQKEFRIAFNNIQMFNIVHKKGRSIFKINRSARVYSLCMGDSSWIGWFLSFRGNEFFCSVDEEFISDRFNITGIGHDIPHFKKAYELVSGVYGTFIFLGFALFYFFSRPR
jgi:hypothetical protein